jgi:hypothetical protein
VNEKIIDNTQETLKEVRHLRRQPSTRVVPFVNEGPEGPVPQDLRAGGLADNMAVSKLEQVVKELDGFSHVLKSEQDSWYSQHQNDAETVALGITEDDEAELTGVDVKQLQKVLQEVEEKLELRETARSANIVNMSCDGSCGMISTTPTSQMCSAVQLSDTVRFFRRARALKRVQQSQLGDLIIPEMCGSRGGRQVLMDAYDIFAFNVVLIVYFDDKIPPSYETALIRVILAGTLIGQVVLGFLADWYERRKMYKLELLVVLSATLGVAMRSTGAKVSMNLMA